MENGEWIHYPAKPGHYGCWEYVVGDKHHILLVNRQEVYIGKAGEGNIFGVVGFCEKGAECELNSNGDLMYRYPDAFSWPEVNDVEHACAWLEQLFLTGAWKNYVKE